MIRVHVGRACAGALAILSLLGAERASARPLALVGGEVHVGDGRVLEGAAVIVDGGVITAVGGAIPADAERIDCAGQWITPGFVAARTQLGVAEIPGMPETVDSSPALPDAIHAAVRMDEIVNPRSQLIPVARRHGVTSAIVQPTGGLVSGRSAWLDLAEPTPDAPAAARGPIALHAYLGEVGAGPAGGSRAQALARLRELFDDARTYQRQRAAFDANALRRLSASRLDLEAVLPVLERKIPLVVDVRRASDVLAVIALGESEKIRVVIEGADEAWLVADALARAKVSVILNPMQNLPERLDRLGARQDAAAILAKAGVDVVLTADSSHNAGNLRFAAGNAVRAGLDPARALTAVTAAPARAFGLADRYGTIERGKVANVVVWTGDPFEPASYAARVFVAGRATSTESRQTRLRDRYLDRLGLRARATR